MKSTINKFLRTYLNNKILYSILLIYIVSCIVTLFGAFLIDKPVVFSDALGDYFVNYQAGFIRRGLTGELFYHIYGLTGIHLSILIKSISLCCIFLLVFLMIKIMVKKKMSFYLILLPITGVAILFQHPNFAGFRKDSLFLVVFIACIYLIKKLGTIKYKFVVLLLINICGSFVILIHEATAFFFIPILYVCILSIYYKQYSLVQSALVSTIVMLPIFISFIACVIFKGNENMAIQIWESWTPYFQRFDLTSLNTPLNQSTTFSSLGWSTEFAIHKHISINFLSKQYGIPSALFWPIIFILFYSLLLRANKVKIGKVNEKEFNQVVFSEIIIFQFLCMLPLFIFLSCDYSRLFLYWSITSITPYCILPESFLKKIFPSFFERINRNLVKASNKISFLDNTKIYIIITLIMGISASHFNIVDGISDSVIGTPISLLIEIIEKFIA